MFPCRRAAWRRHRFSERVLPTPEPTGLTAWASRPRPRAGREAWQSACGGTTPFRRIFSGVSAGPLTPGFRCEPSFSLKAFRPAAVKPPLGSFRGCLRGFVAGISRPRHGSYVPNAKAKHVPLGRVYGTPDLQAHRDTRPAALGLITRSNRTVMDRITRLQTYPPDWYGTCSKFHQIQRALSDWSGVILGGFVTTTDGRSGAVPCAYPVLTCERASDKTVDW